MAQIYKNPLEQAQEDFNKGKISAGQLDDVALANDPTQETLDEFKARLGRHPSNDEYREWIKPRIAKQAAAYKEKGLSEKDAIAELLDAYGYEDLVKEAYYGRPKRSDIEIWRDRLKNTNVEPYTKNLSNLSDEQVQQLIDAFGFDRKGEW